MAISFVPDGDRATFPNHWASTFRKSTRVTGSSARHTTASSQKALYKVTIRTHPRSQKNLVESLNAHCVHSVKDTVTSNPVTVTVAYHVLPGREGD
ncbi:hypothetical protein ABZ646_45355, partial [Streptomyces sp. NPDC007162]